MASRASNQDSLVGSELGRYRIAEKVGVGGMGEVYRAHDQHLARDVAIKVLPPGALSDESARKHFHKEALILSQLNHPNVATIHDFDTQRGVDFLVMEYIPGITLSEKLAGRPLPEKDVLRLGVQLADGLAAAHDQGVVHRDLKPGNLRVTADGRLKILDFGLAKLRLPVANSAATESLSQTQVMAGTLPYMAPEQLLGGEIDARTDIHAAGSVLYEMATGQRPFAEVERAQIIDAILHRRPRSPKAFNPKLSPELERIIGKCLEKEPENRYQSAKELAVDLRRMTFSHTDSGGPYGRVPGPTTALFRSWYGSCRKLIPQPLVSLPIMAAGLVIVALAIILVPSRHSPADSIAVMPFTWLNTGTGVPADVDSEYLSDGITETLIDAVSQLPNVKVIAASSIFRYKGRAIDFRSVGDELKVRKVLTGRIVQHRDSLTISLELVDANSDRHLWGERIERNVSALASLPRDIAVEVGDQLRMGPGPQSLKPYTISSEAYQTYLKGLYYWNKRTEADLQKAISYFNQAVAQDPKYARAYAGLANSYHVLPVYSSIDPTITHDQAQAAALKAVQIDDTLAEGHTSLAAIMADDDWDFAAAEHQFQRAIALNPNYATAHQWYAQSLTHVGNFDQALDEIRKSQELDPLSLIINVTAGDILIRAQRYDQAIAQLRKATDLNKNFPWTHSVLRDVSEYKGMFLEAIAENEAAMVAQGDPADNAKRVAASLREAYTKSGQDGYWRARVQRAEQDIREGKVVNYDESPYRIASFYAHLGDTDSVVQWLQKALEQRSIGLAYVRTAPEFQAFHSDPRVVKIMKQMGLPL